MSERIPPEFLEVSNVDSWKPCIKCGGELIQVRKALFTCLKCNQEYIADEEDMKLEDNIFKIRKLGRAYNRSCAKGEKNYE